MPFGDLIEDAENRRVSLSLRELGGPRFHGAATTAVRSDDVELDIGICGVRTSISDQTAHHISMFDGYVNVDRRADNGSAGGATERSQPGGVDVEDSPVMREPHEARQPSHAGLQECWRHTKADCEFRCDICAQR